MSVRGGTVSQVMQTAAVATGAGTPIDVTGLATLCAQVTGITTATITWEATMNGSTWTGLLAAPITTGTGALTATADGIYRMDVRGLQAVRARMSAWTSGAVTVVGIATEE